jgi:hypothetical protein
MTPEDGNPAPRPAVCRTRLRRLLVWTGLAGTLVVLVLCVIRLAANPGVMPPADFAMYWAAGRLNAYGENPYSPERALALQREAGRDLSDPFLMYSPPWTLPLVMPFGLLPSRVGQLLWLLLHLSVMLCCADRVWLLYGGRPELRWLAWVLTAGFFPTLILLRMGQIGSLVLLGVVGFLSFERRGQLWLAGAAVALTAVKPHLVYLLWVALVLWALDRRRWRVLLGAGLALLLATAIPLTCNPAVIRQYRQALATHPPTEWLTPTLGAALRLWLGADRAWLQFLPALFGLLWFLVYWAARRRNWRWTEQTPLLVLVSFLTTFYGAWSHDFVVLLVPVLQVAVWCVQSRPRAPAYFALGAYLAMDALAFALSIRGANEFWLVWMTPGLLVPYVALSQWARKRNHLAKLGETQFVPRGTS